MSFKVVNVFNLPDADFGDKLLEPLGATLVNGMWRTEAEIVENVTGADAIICSATHQPFNRHVLGILPNCRILASVGIGYNLADLEAATEYGIVVTNVPDYCLDEVSGRALAFMLALNHRLLILDRAVREKQTCFVLDRKDLKEVAHPIYRMRDQTLGIIGLGKIGTATAIKARGHGMKVIAYDPYVLEGVMENLGVEPVNLDTLLRDSDFISIHTPLTEETSNMIRYEEFKKMKSTSYFINTARGGCVEEAGLIRALQEGIIAGAGLDVNATEPIPADSPLLKMPNVILTGHSAGFSISSDPELWYKPMTQVVKALKGEWPPYAVNPHVKSKWLNKWGRKG